MTSAPLDVASSIHYLSLLLADQPRRIDAVIDYFGDTSPGSPREARAHGAGRSVARIASTARSA